MTKRERRNEWGVNKLKGSTLTSGWVSHFESNFNFNVKNDKMFYTNMLLR
jgi:hypothetical protein